MTSAAASPAVLQNATGASGGLPDWPGPGPIDLELHDRPHASSTMEWWYLNTHFTTADGRQFSLFASFFRVEAEAETAERPRRHGHHMTWALVDVAGHRYLYDTLLDPEAPGDGLKIVDKLLERSKSDQPMKRALREVFVKGRVPGPDRVLSAPADVPLDRLALRYGENRYTRLSDGRYELALSDPRQGIGCRLVFAPDKAAVRHGNNGVVCRNTGDDEMFYYFLPSCAVEGEVRIDGRDLVVTKGRGWYDHEFGRSSGEETGPTLRGVSWNWISAQLENGWELNAFDVANPAEGRTLERRVIAVDPQGGRHEYLGFTLEPLESWTSTRTFNDYPTKWQFEIPEANIALTLESEFPRQEYLTLLAAPAFWEGRIRASGTMAGSAVHGLGFVERTGFSGVEKLEDFFSAVGKETRIALDRFLPASPTVAQALALVGSENLPHWVDGVDLDQFTRTVVAPIRHVIDRGGKAWRSYGLIACIDVLGGDSERFRNWLAMPELLHVGSLIVDDVQDGSDVRRGGPACHTVFGEALAINAGTVCYFFAVVPLLADRLPAERRVHIYEAYFEAMRAAHTGQALDIDGLSQVAPRVVESGDGALLEQRVVATHRLKSAVAPGALARMAARLVDASPAQIDGVGALFEAFGLAFQVVDDVLNLRGFQRGLKTMCEDLSHGKVTAPVAKAMSRLDLPQRRQLWEIISSRTTDVERLAQAVELIDGCGALDACEQDARDMIENAWQQVEPLLPDSHVKLRLRAFGWFVLARHY